MPELETATPTAAVTAVRPNEQVRFFPTCGRRVQGGWELDVRGFLFEPSASDHTKKIFVRLLRRVLKATPDDLDSPIFRDRVTGFMHRGRAKRSIAVRLGDQVHLLNKRTRRSGHFFGRVTVNDAVADQCSCGDEEGQRCLAYSAELPTADRRAFIGRVRLLEPTGISVVSDIDDTIKHTGVGQKGQMLQNTFLKEFAAVDGMAKLFQSWSAAGASFHFASSSPWQLFDPLVALLDSVGFPEGSWHLRRLKFRDPSVLQLFVARRMGKRFAVRSLLRRFPQRRFVLVGDSGEKDPEIYGALARRYRDQVSRIFIRSVPHKPITVMRASKAFRKLPPERIRVFSDPAELADLLPTPGDVGMTWQPEASARE